MEVQNKNPNDFNGWKFLEWKLIKKEVDVLLRKLGINIEHTCSHEETGTRIRIQYQKIETWLYFDLADHLAAITQHKDFHVTDKKKADKFFENLQDEYIRIYGKPDQNTDNKREEVITLIWNCKYTRISFMYDYRYKIIDELGCGTYRIDIHIFPLALKHPMTNKF